MLLISQVEVWIRLENYETRSLHLLTTEGQGGLQHLIFFHSFNDAFINDLLWKTTMNQEINYTGKENLIAKGIEEMQCFEILVSKGLEDLKK